MEDFDEDLGHRFSISGGEVIDLDEQAAPHPISTSTSFNMPTWMRNYRKLQEKIMDTTTATPLTKAEVLLYQLHEYELAQLDIQLKKQELIDQVLTPEIKQAIDDISAEFAGRYELAEKKVAETKAEIKIEVLKLGHTIENEFYQVQWKKGSAGGYDTKKLDGMAALIPQLKTALKPDGQPTVSFNPKK